jgi:hypothetical protein
MRATQLPDEVSIDYQLGQHGWSQFTLAVGAVSTVVGPFGYCSDALGDLGRVDGFNQHQGARKTDNG